MSEDAILEHCGPTQRRMLECLLHQPDGFSVEGLAGELGITPSAVRLHLTGLTHGGLVARIGQQPTRGRPEQLYALTALGREAFPRR